MTFDKEMVLIFADYIKQTYNDPHAHLKLKAFTDGAEMGWSNGIAYAANYVHNWHTHMDPVNESSTRGLIREIEAGILELEFGDV